MSVVSSKRWDTLIATTLAGLDLQDYEHTQSLREKDLYFCKLYKKNKELVSVLLAF